MNHSSAHGHMNQMSSEEIIADIKKCNDQIEALTGECPTLFRAPYGEYDDHVIAAVRSIGMEPIQWDVDSLDWKEISAGEIYERVTSRVKPGSIILFHNAGLNTPEALPDILEYLIGEGYEVVPSARSCWMGVHHRPRGTPVGCGVKQSIIPAGRRNWRGSARRMNWIKKLVSEFRYQFFAVVDTAARSSACGR